MTQRPAWTAAALVIGLMLVGSAATAAATIAASAVPSSSAEPAGDTNLEVWLDAPLTPDAPAGDTLAIGFTVWDTVRHDFSEVTGPFLRLHPATGSAAPSTTTADSDWPGHLVANVQVPKGGPGAIEVGFDGQTCRSDGTCVTSFFPFRFGGAGPPPEAPLARLIEATIHPPEGILIEDVPIDLTVDVVRRAAWDPSVVPLPDQLVAVVNQRGAPDTATAVLRPTAGRRDGPYRGKLTIATSGDFTLSLLIPSQGGQDFEVAGSVLRLTVEAVDAGDTTPAPPIEEGIPLPLAGSVVLLVLAGALVIRRVFADL
jgi:hypothetical protein